MSGKPEMDPSTEKQYLKEATIKVESLKDTIDSLEENLQRKRDALKFYEEREREFSSRVRRRALRKLHPDM